MTLSLCFIWYFRLSSGCFDDAFAHRQISLLACNASSPPKIVCSIPPLRDLCNPLEPPAQGRILGTYFLQNNLPTEMRVEDEEMSLWPQTPNPATKRTGKSTIGSSRISAYLTNEYLKPCPLLQQHHAPTSNNLNFLLTRFFLPLLYSMFSARSLPY